jgi:hypothetical protein
MCSSRAGGGPAPVEGRALGLRCYWHLVSGCGQPPLRRCLDLVPVVFVPLGDPLALAPLLYRHCPVLRLCAQPNNMLVAVVATRAPVARPVVEPEVSDCFSLWHVWHALHVVVGCMCCSGGLSAWDQRGLGAAYACSSAVTDSKCRLSVCCLWRDRKLFVEWQSLSLCACAGQPDAAEYMCTPCSGNGGGTLLCRDWTAVLSWRGQWSCSQMLHVPATPDFLDLHCKGSVMLYYLLVFYKPPGDPELFPCSCPFGPTWQLHATITISES